MTEKSSQTKSLMVKLNHRISETNNVFSLFSNSLTAVTWISLNIVALYIFFTDYYPLFGGDKLRYMVAGGLGIVSD